MVKANRFRQCFRLRAQAMAEEDDLAEWDRRTPTPFAANGRKGQLFAVQEALRDPLAAPGAPGMGILRTSL